MKLAGRCNWPICMETAMPPKAFIDTSAEGAYEEYLMSYRCNNIPLLLCPIAHIASTIPVAHE